MGDLHYRADVSGPLVITEVATQFNQMLDAIVESQRELRKSGTRLQLAIDRPRLAIWEADIIAAEITFSESWAQLIGEPSGVKIYTFEDFSRHIPPGDFDIVDRHSAADWTDPATRIVGDGRGKQAVSAMD